MVTLVQRMRARTAEPHLRAEQSGIVAAILAGQVSQSGYALYLRNLLPVYLAMEHALRCNRDRPGIGYLAQPSIYRASSIIADLGNFAGSGWAVSLPLLASGERYAARVTRAGRGDGALLIAHAYTRYLGDLNGGRILRRRLVRRFGRDFPAAFTEFTSISDVGAFTTRFSAALNRAGDSVSDAEPVVQEAAIAFEMNIQLSREVDDFRPASVRHNWR
jgi:heme oxygenase (biliverdin-producing, ferredoxin)